MIETLVLKIIEGAIAVGDEILGKRIKDTNAQLLNSAVLNTPASAPRAHFRIYKVCVTAQEMRAGPSEPACRSRLQSTLSCVGKEPR